MITKTGDPNLTVAPATGEWLAWITGQDNVSNTLYQDFSVPAGLTGARLRYSLLVTSDEPGGANDYFYVRLRQLDGTVLQELLLDNTFAPKNQWVQREVNLIDLSPWSGQTLRLSFKGTTNAAYVTNFYLDDVSLITTGP